MIHPYSLKAFHDFCVRKGDETFVYTSMRGCACAQYAHSIGVQYEGVSYRDRPNSPFWATIEKLAAGRCIAANFEPVKWSDLAARVKEAMANE